MKQRLQGKRGVALLTALTATLAVIGPMTMARANDGHRDGERHEERRDAAIRRDIRRDEFRRNQVRDEIRHDRFEEHRIDAAIAHRQDEKNQWRNLGYLGAATTVYGLLRHDPTITFVGAAGTLYSVSRYEQDRRSEDEIARARYGLFERGWFERDGVRYTRHECWRNGEKFYYFAR